MRFAAASLLVCAAVSVVAQEGEAPPVVAPTPTPRPLIAAREVDLDLLVAAVGSSPSSSGGEEEGSQPPVWTGYGSTVFRGVPPASRKEESTVVVARAEAWIRRRMGLPGRVPPPAPEPSAAEAEADNLLLPPVDFSLSSLVGADIVHSETGAGPTPVTFVRQVPGEGGAGSPPVAEEVVQTPVFGRMYWLTLEGRHPVPAAAPGPANGTVRPDLNGAPALVRHTLTVTLGVPHGELAVYRHTWEVVAEEKKGDAEVSAEVSADGTVTTPTEQLGAAAEPTTHTPALRVLTYNVWNSNPPRWLWKDPRDRARQYALRLWQLGDVVRHALPDIVAFQEVRYDSTLGGFDPDAPPFAVAGVATEADAAPLASADDGGDDTTTGRYAAPATIDRSVPYDYKLAWAVSQMWYNRTRQFGETARYQQRNVAKWGAITGAAGWDVYGRSHPFEGQEAGDVAHALAVAATEAAFAAQLAARARPDADPTMSPFPPTPPPVPVRGKGLSPYLNPPPRGAPSYPRIQRAMLTSPHAQIEHLAAHLPGYHFVYAPGQLYLDKDAWLTAPARDEEGPAVFSRYPIVHSDYLLLSRNASDDADGHQRLCLHAVIDVSASLDELTGGKGTGGAAASEELAAPVLVDVYTVHLALSEAARNRTVQELRDYIRRSARGSAVVLTGDMNAEPHEAAMRELVEAVDSPVLGDVFLHAGYPEPTPRDPDQAARRYAFTFPSDDPVKRIDLMFVGSRSEGEGGDKAAALCPRTDGGADGASLPPGCVGVGDVYVVGQDALPGTEATEGAGHGMVSDRSPVYGSDHRGLMAHLRVPVPRKA
jgi:endonuclease/exonuclease/phosphatase family metal-dependent hydrolase